MVVPRARWVLRDLLALVLEPRGRLVLPVALVPLVVSALQERPVELVGPEQQGL